MTTTNDTTPVEATEVLPTEPILHCLDLSAHGMEDAVTLGQGLPTTHNELPAHYRWADALKIGTKYTHPTNGYEVDASAGNVKKIEDSFARMKANRVDSPFVEDHQVKAKSTLGYVMGTRRKDGWLQVLLQILGDDSLNTARKNKISLGLRRTLKDAHGNSYELGIEHCAATPMPVVSGQQQLLAASRIADGEEVVYLLSAADPIPPTPERSVPMKAEHRAKALALLSGVKDLKPDADDETVMNHLLAQHEGEQKDNSNLREFCANLSMSHLVSQPEVAEFFPSLAPEVLALSRSVTEKDAEILALSRGAEAEVEPDPRHLSESAKLKMERIDLMMHRGDLTGAMADRARAMVYTKDKQPNTFMLSRNEETGDECVVDLFLSMFDGAKMTTPKTPNEIIVLSRDSGTPGIVDTNADPAKPAEPAVVTPARVAQILGTIGLTPTKTA